MDFGVFNVLQQRQRTKTSAQVMDDALAQVRHAEDLGFSRVWFVEHHFSNYSLCPSPLVMCAYAAGITKRIRMGTAVVLPALYSPARLIAEIAMVDKLSDGRLDLGVGTGYQRYEFERFHVELDDSRAMMLEMLEMIEAGLSQPNFSFKGKFWEQPQTAINIRPVQRPHPPIWMTAKDPASLKRAAERGYTPFMSSRFASLDELRPLRNNIDTVFQGCGVDTTHLPLGLLSFIGISRNPQEIDHYLDCSRYQQRIARALRERREVMVDDYWVEEVPFANEPTLEDAKQHVLAGEPEQVTEKLVRILKEIRPSHMTFYFQVGDIPLKQALESMRLFVEEVIPGVEKAFGKPIAEINRPAPLVPRAAQAAAE